MRTLLLATLALAGSAALLPAQTVTKQTCDGRDPVGYLGISGIDCNCTIAAPGSDRPWHFRTEPKVTSLEMDSPAGRFLKPGDVITHVNGKLITTAEGAAALAALRPGEAVVLRVRRGRQTLTYAMTAEAACPADTRLLGIYAPSASPAVRGRLAPRAEPPAVEAPARTPQPERVAPKAPPQAISPRVTFGMGLTCKEDCFKRSDSRSGETIISFSREPEVYSIERGGAADQAGIRRGDVITHVNGKPITTEAGSEVFARVRPGDIVRFTVRRGAENPTFAVRSVARLAPQPELASSSRSLDKARASLDELRRAQDEQLKRIQEEMRESQRVEAQKLREMQREMVQREQEHRRKLTELSRELSSAQQRMRAALADSLRAACPVATGPLTPGARSTLRYTGVLGGTEIEVRGASPVSVTESGSEVEISAGATVVRLKDGRKK